MYAMYVNTTCQVIINLISIHYNKSQNTYASTQILLPLKQGRHAYKLKYFSPFLSLINKGFKVKANQTNFTPPFFCQKQRDQEGVIQINQ